MLASIRPADANKPSSRIARCVAAPLVFVTEIDPAGDAYVVSVENES